MIALTTDSPSLAIDLTWVAIINAMLILGALVTFYWKYRQFTEAEAEARLKRDIVIKSTIIEECKHYLNSEDVRNLHNETITRGCREYTNSYEYRINKDKRIQEIAQITVDESFRERAPSFVDAAVWETERRNYQDHQRRIEAMINENTKAVSELAGKISAMITISRKKALFDDK